MKPKISTLRNKADRLYQELGRLLANRCEVCGGEYSCRHHFFPKSMCSALRYNMENGIALCSGCHLKHHCGNPTIHKIVLERRGDKWYNNLLNIKNTYVKTDKNFYEENIKKLQEEIEKAKS